MRIYESGENYLEAILLLKNERGDVRSVDVARHLNFSKPSVSRAMSVLKKGGLIVVDEPSGVISFTDEGFKKATSVYKRHGVITQFLMSIGVDHNIAELDACRIEHVISEETLNCMKLKK